MFGRKRLLYSILTRFTLFLNIVWISCAAFVHFYLNAPLKYSKTFIIERNSTIKLVGQRLEKDNIFTYPFVLRLYSLFYSYSPKPGEYYFASGMQPLHILSDIQQGRNFKRYLSIPEGLTIEAIIEKLKTHEDLTGAIEDMPIEGTLLPQTYQFSKGDQRQDILQRMQVAMNQRLDYYWAHFPYKNILKTKYDFLILASIVEKETARDVERPIIARVFLNRLQKGMRLQADPTVAYGARLIQKNNDIPLSTIVVYKKHIQMDHPYNTYKNAGLPPGPICCPGEQSLKAVAMPDSNNFIFFVANGQGGHHFTEVFHQHQQNHAFWRRFKRTLK